MRVVIDTNVWVSRLLLADSVTARTVDAALESSEVVISEPLAEELANVLAREKFDRYVSLADREEFLRRLLQVATTVPVLTEVTDCRGADDNRILALALDAESDYILTGDQDLLTMNPWREIEIVSPRAFLETTASEAPPQTDQGP